MCSSADPRLTDYDTLLQNITDLKSGQPTQVSTLFPAQGCCVTGCCVDCAGLSVKSWADSLQKLQRAYSIDTLHDEGLGMYAMAACVSCSEGAYAVPLNAHA